MLRLRRRKIETHVATARGQFGPLGERIQDLTREQVQRERLPIDQIHFAKDKVPVLLELAKIAGSKKDVFFLDDRAHYIEDAWMAGFRNAYLLDERWNQGSGVKRQRVYSTRQFVDIVCAYADSRATVDA